MSEVIFLEYNVNPNDHKISDVIISLRMLGFLQISTSRNEQATMWSANKCVLLLSRKEYIPTGISGIGCNTDAPDGSIYCETTGMNLVKDHNGFNIYTHNIENFKKTYDKHFITIGDAGTSLPVDNIVGFVYKDVFKSNNIFNDELKFRKVKQTDNFTTTVCKNNRFNIVWDESNQTNNQLIDTIIVKTDDIVDATAKLVSNGFNSEKISTARRNEIISKVDKNPEAYPAKHVLNGWDFNLGGKPKSFVVEKRFENVLPNLDLILSRQHNHNGINTETLMYYSEIESDINEHARVH